MSGGATLLAVFVVLAKSFFPAIVLKDWFCAANKVVLFSCAIFTGPFILSTRFYQASTPGLFDCFFVIPFLPDKQNNIAYWQMQSTNVACSVSKR